MEFERANYVNWHLQEVSENAYAVLRKYCILERSHEQSSGHSKQTHTQPLSCITCVINHSFPISFDFQTMGKSATCSPFISTL